MKESKDKLSNKTKQDAKDRRFMYKLLAVTTSFIYEAIASILIGGVIGYGLDYLFGLDGLLLIIFMVFGAMAAVINFIRRIYRMGVNEND
ncbi:MAG: AtpZ/AtpI family protein [Bacillota bacterium]